MRQTLIAAILLVLSTAMLAQPRQSASVHPETGRPFMSTFDPIVSGSHPQTWDILQDERGVIFIGNGIGITIYDGASWRTISTPNKSVVRSLAMDENGRIYAGSAHDMGYLQPDTMGTLAFVSLITHLDETERDFNDVWTTIATPDGIYFQARERVFRFRSVRRDGEEESWEVKSWEPTTRFFYAFWRDNTYYVHQSEIGMMKLVDDELELVPGTESLGDERLQVFLPYPDDEDGTPRYLVGKFNSGLMLWDKSGFHPFPTEVDEKLRSGGLYKGVTLPNGTYALGMLSAGMVVIDRNGKRLLQLDDQSGLPSNSVMDLFVDRQGTLWVGSEGGISLLETPSPLSRYTVDNGLRGLVGDIIRFKDRLYVSTTQGVYFLDHENSQFTPLEGMATGNTQSWWFVETHGQLLVSTGTGLYSIDGTRLTMIKPNENDTFDPTRLHVSRQDPDVLWVGMRDGLLVMHYENGRWVDQGLVPGVSSAVTHIAEEKPGELWLGFISNGVARVTVDTRNLLDAVVENYSDDRGLPAGGVSIYDVAGELAFLTKDGGYRYLSETDEFERDTTLEVVSFGGSQEEYSLEEDYQGNLWVNFGAETALMRKLVDGSYLKEQTPLLRFEELAASDIYAEDDGVVWFGGDHVMVRFDPRVAKNYALDFTTLIRGVATDDGYQIYGGSTGMESEPLASDMTALRFSYSGTTYEAPGATRYSTMLEGFDEDWSSWTAESRRDYTNLPAGSYTFRAKAKNIYLHEGSEASYALTILPPWSETWWAWMLYAAGAGFVLFGLVRIRTRKLEAQSAVLEQEVKDRTVELQGQKEEIEKSYENIELLSKIGRDITSNLSTEGIIETVYENVNALMDASVFGIGLYNAETRTIDFPASKEKGETLPAFSYDIRDPDRLAVWCYSNRKEVFINDYIREYMQYVQENPDPLAGESPESVIYLPLIHHDEVIGTITAQSFRKHAYNDYHLNILKNLATYTAIALDNARAYKKLNETLERLRITQEQLITSEKMASLGSLTGGIAHEIKNPLNFITNFAELNEELADELAEELESNKDKKVGEILDELNDLLSSLKINSAQISQHGQRADGIVSSMMQHASGAHGERQQIDLNALVEEYVNLAYHGMHGQVKDFNVTIKRELEAGSLPVEAVPQDIGRVMLNLLNNAFYSVDKYKQEQDADYAPTVTIQTRRSMRGVEVTVTDNGSGMSREVRDKIFEPFFTTKPTGSGTGLGLSLSYEIITQDHNGSLSVSSEEGKGASFTFSLPVGE